MRLDSTNVTSKEFVPQTKTGHKSEVACPLTISTLDFRTVVRLGEIALHPRAEVRHFPAGLMLEDGRKLGG